MTNLILPRRKFLTGLMGLVAAPAVVKAASLMPVKVIRPEWQYTEVSMGYFITREEINAPSSGVNLAELRELLMPGLRKMADVYTEHPGWKSVFLEK